MNEQENKRNFDEENSVNESEVGIDFDEDDEYDAKNSERKLIDWKEKLKLLLKKLEVYCNDESEHNDLRKLGNAIQNGEKLTGTILSGGYTNYSYKIHLDCDDGNDNGNDRGGKNASNGNKKELAVFAKIAFPYALWSPDKSVPYDLNRVTIEFELTKQFPKN